MRHRHKPRAEAGFTLVELMITVVILGVLAAVAIPSFTGFLRESKISEASINIRAISHGAISWFNDTHNNANGKRLKAHFPNKNSPHGVPTGSSPISLPTDPPCKSGSPLYPVNTQRGEVQPWKTLKFAIRRAHYFQYTYDANGISTNAYFAIGAIADLQCRNQFRTFIQCGMVNKKTGEVERSNLLDIRGKADAATVCKPSP